MFFKSRKPFSVLPPSQPDQMVGEQTGGTVERHVSLDITGHYSLHFQTSFPNSTTYFLSPVNTHCPYAQSSAHHFNLLLSLKVPQITSCYMTPVQGTKRIFWSIRWCKTWQFITSEYFRRISCYIDRCYCQWRVNLKKEVTPRLNIFSETSTFHSVTHVTLNTSNKVTLEKKNKSVPVNEN